MLNFNLGDLLIFIHFSGYLLNAPALRIENTDSYIQFLDWNVQACIPSGAENPELRHLKHINFIDIQCHARNTRIHFVGITLEGCSQREQLLLYQFKTM